MNEVDTFIDFAAGYDRGFPLRIAGAAPERIERLQELVGRPLPRLFRDYLARMGVDHGGLLMELDAYCHIERLIKEYEEYGTADYFRPACDGFVPLGYGKYQGDYFVEIGGSHDPRVFAGDRPEATRLYSESFHKLLYRAAFWAFYLLPMPYGSLQGPHNAVPWFNEVRRFCLDQGFEPHWFSGAFCFLAEANDVAIYLMQTQDEGFFLRLGSRRRAAAAQWRERLLREFGFPEAECRM